MTYNVDTDTMTVSNSEIQSFKRCPRNWWLVYYRGLRPRSAHPLGARATGNRVHSALEGYYVPEGQTPVAPLEALTVSQVADWDLLRAGFDDDNPMPEHISTDWAKAIDLERAMIQGYVEWLGKTGADSDFEVVASEQKLSVPYCAPGVTANIELIGKIDARLLRRSDGLRFFMDHKTVADFARLERNLQGTEQLLHYNLLEVLSDPDGPRVAGAIHNMLRKVKRTGTAKPPFYLRTETMLSSVQLDLYDRRLAAIVRDMWRLVSRLETSAVDPYDYVWPVQADTCSWWCDFAQVCPMMDDGSRAEDMLRDLYVAGDPNERYTAEAQ